MGRRRTQHELTETIDRSLKRGRTIELHYEEYSEASSTFKGMMSAIGCCLLMVGLFAVVLVGVLEDFLRRHVPPDSQVALYPARRARFLSGPAIPALGAGAQSTPAGRKGMVGEPDEGDSPAD